MLYIFYVRYVDIADIADIAISLCYVTAMLRYVNTANS